MAQTKEERRVYKAKWEREKRLKDPAYAERQRLQSAKTNAKRKIGKVYKILNDIVGMKFNRLTVISKIDTKSRYTKWLCLCDCGNTLAVYRHYLKCGDVKSCGCLLREGNARTHGDRNAKEYDVWSSIKTRCYNPKCKSYPNYGGRGITVCDRWLDSYEAFLLDMGRAPSKTHTIDRFPNVNGNYGPDNCRWATRVQQSKNKRNNILVEYNGEKKLIIDLALQYNIKYTTLRSRIVVMKWPVYKSIETPVREKKKIA